MMKIWLMCSMLAVSMCGSTWGNEYRAFTAKDGRAIEARIVEYDAKRQQLRIERRGGKTLWVAPGVFGTADQTYIQEWIAADVFLSGRLTVSLEKKGQRPFNEHTRVDYELKFRNIFDTPIQITGIECMSLIRRKVFLINGVDKDYLYRPSGLIEESEETVWGKWKSSSQFQIEPGSQAVLLPFTFILDTKMREEQIKGVWVRIKGPVFEGQATYREVRIPEKLKPEGTWTETNESARSDMLNPSGPKKKIATRKPGEQPADEQEYKTWFWEIYSEGHYYMRTRPVQFEQAKKSYEELKAFYNEEYESDYGARAGLVARLAYMVKDYVGCAEWYERSLGYENSILFNRAQLCALYSSGIKGVTDGEKAISLGKELIAEKPEDIENHELLARAYARAGQFDQAVKTQQVVIDLVKKQSLESGQEPDLERYVERMSLFKEGRPYYDRPPDSFS